MKKDFKAYSRVLREKQKELDKTLKDKKKKRESLYRELKNINSEVCFFESQICELKSRLSLREKL